MKTKTWTLLLVAIFLVCGALTIWLFAGNQGANGVEIWSEGKKIFTLSLMEDQTVEVVGTKGSNTIQIEDGAIAVINATCPDSHCISRGFCSGGAQIVCLPNELVIKFTGEQAIDGMVG